MLAWRTGTLWRGRIIQDNEGDVADVDYHDEAQMLWGCHESDRNDGFVLLNEGKEGPRHAPPAISDEQVTPKTRMFLKVRHYFGNDGDGQVFIAFSRLISIFIASLKEEL